MLLSEFLNYFDFDYEVINGQIRLIDLQGAYLGDIGECSFDISDLGKSCLVDRLDIYIKDYITEDLAERLVEAGVGDVDEMTLADMAKAARKKDVSCDLEVIDAVVNPSSLDFEKEKIAKSFSVGQIFYDKGPDKYIVLDNLCKDSDDIWNFRVYDKDMNYLYDTTVFDLRLAKDIINGDVVSVTHEKVLRVEPNCLLVYNGEVSASLEDNIKLWNRFNDYVDVGHGDLKYVTVRYDKDKDDMFFKLHFDKFDDATLGVIRETLDVPAEKEEKEALLKEMRFLKPEFFKNTKKPELNAVIEQVERESSDCGSRGINRVKEDMVL